MFRPYDLFTFMDTLPDTWQTHFHLTIGHPERDHDFLLERSPETHLDALAAPMPVVQGRNDPCVVVGESDMLVDELRERDTEIGYLVFDGEGHGMVKRANKVEVYTRIVGFFADHPGVE